jgi:hypothetical protein
VFGSDGCRINPFTDSSSLPFHGFIFFTVSRIHPLHQAKDIFPAVTPVRNLVHYIPDQDNPEPARDTVRYITVIGHRFKRGGIEGHPLVFDGHLNPVRMELDNEADGPGFMFPVTMEDAVRYRLIYGELDVADQIAGDAMLIEENPDPVQCIG